MPRIANLVIVLLLPKTKNNDGKTALMVAAEGGHDETVAVLTQAGAGT